jgi:signal transduction histidine kinase
VDARGLLSDEQRLLALLTAAYVADISKTALSMRRLSSSSSVRDDGVGGAQPEGSRLLGLTDRLAVPDGRLRVESPPDGGTLVAAVIPVAAACRMNVRAVAIDESSGASPRGRRR